MNNREADRFQPQSNWLLLRHAPGQWNGGRMVQLASGQSYTLPIARVLNVGADVKRAKVGDLVLVAGGDLKRIDEQVWLVKDEHVLCRVDDDAKATDDLPVVQPAKLVSAH